MPPPITPDVPEHPNRPGWDVFEVQFASRGHYIHQVLAAATAEQSAAQIGQVAEPLARRGGYLVRDNTFGSDTTGSHLNGLCKSGLAERRKAGRVWVYKLSPRGRQLLAARSAESGDARSDFRVHPTEAPEGQSYPEGAVVRVLVNRYERSAAARAACLAHHGAICSVCRFDFAATYGRQAAGYIHVHHRRDLATIGAEYQVDPITDLIPVCPNCHSVLHLRQPAFDLDDVRAMLNTAPDTTDTRRVECVRFVPRSPRPS